MSQLVSALHMSGRSGLMRREARRFPVSTTETWNSSVANIEQSER